MATHLTPGATFANRYLLVERIGYGGFSEVWKVQRQSGFVQAIKIFTTLDTKGAELARAEFERVFNLNHQHLLKPSDFGVYEGKPYLVMPYCAKGPALRLAGKLEERELAKLCMHIASGLAFLHNLDEPILHQDVKPDNFLIDEQGNYLLSDFGISRKLRKTLTQSALSNRQTQPLKSNEHSGMAPPAYRPPETFSTSLKDRRADKAGDIWAFGASLYELATGELPFDEFGGLVQKNGAAVPELPPDRFSAELNQLLKRCMALDKTSRPTADEIRAHAQYYLDQQKWNIPLPTTGEEILGIHGHIKIRSRYPRARTSLFHFSPQKRKVLLYSMMGLPLLLALLFFLTHLPGMGGAKNGGALSSDSTLTAPSHPLADSNRPASENLPVHKDAVEETPKHIPLPHQPETESGEETQSTDQAPKQKPPNPGTSSPPPHSSSAASQPDAGGQRNAENPNLDVKQVAPSPTTQKEPAPQKEEPETAGGGPASPAEAKPSVGTSSSAENEADREPGINEFVHVTHKPKRLNYEQICKDIGYPHLARENGIEGKVFVRILIDEKGNYVKHQVMNKEKVSDILVKAVEAHISKLRFSPAMQEDKAVKYWTNVSFSFQLLK
ncbi:MAG: hypothetical protein D6730_19685 [Bacteroidetes bacterium]|nr:MAG: hypothetical protein D6730_19685 [Bacteroidota bacterium]